MDSLFENAAEIIREAGSSPLAVFALMVLAISLIAFLFFRHESKRIKTGIFLLMFFCVVLFGWSLFHKPEPDDEGMKTVSRVDPAAGSGGTETVTPPPRPVPARQAGHTLEKKGFVFSLEKCSGSSDTITCYLKITNKGKKRSLILNNNGWLFDDVGNEYRVARIRLGDRSGRYVGTVVETATPVEAVMLFTPVPQRVDHIKRLVVSVHSVSWSKIQFLDIGVARQN